MEQKYEYASSGKWLAKFLVLLNILKVFINFLFPFDIEV